MPQTKLQKIATNWTWIKYYRLMSNSINSGIEWQLKSAGVKLSSEAQYHLNLRELHTKMAIKAIDADVQEAKAAIRAEEKLATSVAPEKEFNSGIYDGQDI